MCALSCFTSLFIDRPRLCGSFFNAAPAIIFHPAIGIDANTVFQVQATLRRRILRAFVGRGVL